MEETNTVNTLQEEALVVGILSRIAGELGAMLGLEMELGAARLERTRARPAGAGSIHVSFKLAFRAGARPERSGCLLVPLADAITLAGFLLMMSEDAVAAWREETMLETPLKNAMLEIGDMIASATASALLELDLARWSVRSAGCQGVRAGIRPALPYVEGSELVVGRVAARVGPFPAGELVLVLPVLD